MPTGYTQIIEDNPDVTFREFALRCARAMGSCVGQRNESLEVPPQAKLYGYALEIARAEAALRDLFDASEQEQRRRFEAERSVALQHNAAQDRFYARCARMADLVRAWTPPSAGHVELKEFMLRQLAPCPYDDMWPVPSDFTSWLSARLRELRDDVARYRELRVKAEARMESDRVWIEQLYASL